MWSSIDVVIFVKIDRMARNVADSNASAEEAQANGAALVSIRDDRDLTTAYGRFVATILAAFAELEAKTIADRTRDGRRAAAAAGRWTGGPIPFGFRSTDNPNGAGRVLAVESGEAAMLHGLVERLASGENLVQATRWANTFGGHPPRRAASWSRNSLESALTNAAASEHILSASERRTVAEAARTKKPRFQGRQPTRILSGLLRCGSCDRPSS